MKNTDVSLSGKTYDRLRTEAKRRGVPICKLAEEIVLAALPATRDAGGEAEVRSKGNVETF